MLFSPSAFYWETYVLPLVGLEKPLSIFKPFSIYVITSIRPTNSSNFVEIGSQEVPTHSDELSQFMTLFLPFFFVSTFSVSSSRLQVTILDRFARFMAQTTCSVSCTCRFRVWSPGIHLKGVSGPKNPKITTRFGLDRFAAEIAQAL